MATHTAEWHVTAQRRAVDAVCKYNDHNYPPELDMSEPRHADEYHRLGRVARERVDDAIRAGVDPDTVADDAGCSLLRMAELVDDTAARLQLLVRARHRAQQQVDAAREQIRAVLVPQLEAGEISEYRAAEAAGVSRPTVRAWQGK